MSPEVLCCLRIGSPAAPLQRPRQREPGWLLEGPDTRSKAGAGLLLLRQDTGCPVRVQGAGRPSDWRQRCVHAETLCSGYFPAACARLVPVFQRTMVAPRATRPVPLCRRRCRWTPDAAQEPELNVVGGDETPGLLLRKGSFQAPPEVGE